MKPILIFLCSCCLLAQGRAQNVSLDFKGGAGPSFIRLYESGDPAQRLTGISNALYISGSGRLVSSFFVRAELGLSSSEHRLDGVLGEDAYRGNLRTQKCYFNILPEFRFLKNELMFVNIGLSAVQDIGNAFEGGINYQDGSRFYGAKSYGNALWLGLTGNAGIRVMFGPDKRVGLVQTIGFNTLFHERVGYFRELSYFSLTEMTGVTFNLN